MKITAQQAYKTAINEQMKFRARGYGRRIVFINTCPDCNGRGIDCATCGNEPDNAQDKVKVGKYWYATL